LRAFFVSAPTTDRPDISTVLCLYLLLSTTSIAGGFLRGAAEQPHHHHSERENEMATITVKGNLVWAGLAEGKPIKNKFDPSKVEYGGTLLLQKTDHAADITKLKAALKDAATAKWGEKVSMREVKFYLADGDQKDSDGEYTKRSDVFRGTFSMKAKNTNVIPLYKRVDGQLVEAKASEFVDGQECAVQFSTYAFEKSNGKQVTTYCQAILLLDATKTIKAGTSADPEDAFGGIGGNSTLRSDPTNAFSDIGSSVSEDDIDWS
jgi:hypothetical protein